MRKRLLDYFVRVAVWCVESWVAVCGQRAPCEQFILRKVQRRSGADGATHLVEAQRCVSISPLLLKANCL